MKEAAAFLLKPWLATLFLEMAAAVLWGVRGKKNFCVVFWVNTLTNPLLNLVLLYLGARYPYHLYRWMLYGMEVLIWFSEGLLFRKFLKQVRHPFLFSLCLNGTSFFLGKYLRWLCSLAVSGRQYLWNRLLL